jgi:uncharacterized protein (DUF2062 family)
MSPKMLTGFRRLLVEEFYKMRTRGSGRGRQALALGLGVFIGASPFWGLHFLMCLLAARFLGLNAVTMYAGAQITYPIFAPFVYFAEIQVGRWIRTGLFYSMTLAEFRDLSPLTFAADLLLGAVVIGLGVGAIAGGLLYAVSRRAHAPEKLRLAAGAARRYFDQGIAAWEYAWGKLKSDPVYFALLERQLLPREGLLLDLGCGRGLLLALLCEAEQLAKNDGWPGNWPPPPRGLTLRGIELRPRPAARARLALGERAVIEIDDIRTARFPAAQAVTLLDVLHYLRRKEQEAVLAAVAQALPPGGVLLIREADAAGGWRFLLTTAAEHVACWALAHFRQRFAFRPAGEWVRMLEALDLNVEVWPMAEGTPFANVLLRAEKN